MEFTKALEHRSTLRISQARRAHLEVGMKELPRQHMLRAAVEDGVPARYAKMIRRELTGPTFDAADKVAAAMDGDALGAEIVGPRLESNTVAGAIFYTAMLNGRCGKWVSFPGLVEQWGRKISLDKANEWEYDEMRGWLADIDLMKYCFDYLVIADVDPSLITPYVGAELYKLLSPRIDNQLYTVFTYRPTKYDVWTEAPAVRDIILEDFISVEVAP